MFRLTSSFRCHAAKRSTFAMECRRFKWMNGVHRLGAQHRQTREGKAKKSWERILCASRMQTQRQQTEEKSNRKIEKVRVDRHFSLRHMHSMHVRICVAEGWKRSNAHTHTHVRPKSTRNATESQHWTAEYLEQKIGCDGRWRLISNTVFNGRQLRLLSHSNDKCSRRSLNAQVIP